ncbi:GLPGLI family protein [Chryseobacterium taklimakanense]|uniref:GLPGLI family protein n=1 Tax=Chryseobacterium taklimakanense TaxID=536441 RepID=UPI000F5E7F21|nr:GLPGLI family protein [Chryseobacterium taklimakanense]AZI22522.1 GLPGLI family protein [Chryseobacterium taklimakanense]
MTIRLTILIIMMFNHLNGQKLRFVYDYRFVPDSSNFKEINHEIMYLDINNSESFFFSKEKFEIDSTILEESKKGKFIMPPNKQMINYRIDKNREKLEIQMKTSLLSTMLNVIDNRLIDWTLIPEYKTILNLSAQKATCKFGGRNWIAYFTREIPINDGPYKFYGLPGLILEIIDITDSHSFKLIGIKKIKKETGYPIIHSIKPTIVTNDRYKELLNNFRKNPTSHLIGKIVDQEDSDGNFRSAQQIIREIEINELKKIKKDNNILEIDLLK